MSKLDLILHPVRMRIITTLTHREMTAGQIAQTMQDVAQTSLYRHINALVEGGILTVVAEKPVRGTVEKLYALKADAARLGQEDIASLTKDDHMRYFTIFLSTLIQDFSAYLEESEDIRVGEFSYNTIPLHLTDVEAAELRAAFGALFAPYLNREISSDSKRYLFSAIVIPDKD